MPVYEFECLACKETFQRTWSVSEYERTVEQGVECPKCKGKDVEQTVTSVMVETSKKS